MSRPGTGPRVWFRMSVVAGNLVQLALMGLSIVLLLAAKLRASRPEAAVVLMLLGFLGVYFSSHAIAHWGVGRLGGIQFVGYGIRGTSYPEAYPPAIRQLMGALPFFTALTDPSSLRQARPWARALMFGAGMTANLLAVTIFGALAVAFGLPGADLLLTITLIASAVATVNTSRTPRGDFAKARRALSQPSAAAGHQTG
jgi:hypothetical protein